MTGAAFPASATPVVCNDLKSQARQEEQDDASTTPSTTPSARGWVSMPSDAATSDADAVFEDLEGQERGSSASTAAAAGEKPEATKGRLFCMRRRCALAAFAALAILALGSVWLWPRRAVWEVSKLNIDQDAISDLIKAFTDPHFNTSKTLELSAEANVFNPNHIGARAGKGHLVVTFRDLVLAEVESAPVQIGGRGHGIVVTKVKSTITPEVSRMMMEVLPPTFVLKPVVVGEVPAKVWGFLQVKVGLRCTVDVHVMMILSDPDHMVGAHECSYSLSF